MLVTHKETWIKGVESMSPLTFITVSKNRNRCCSCLLSQQYFYNHSIKGIQLVTFVLLAVVDSCLCLVCISKRAADLIEGMTFAPVTEQQIPLNHSLVLKQQLRHTHTHTHTQRKPLKKQSMCHTTRAQTIILLQDQLCWDFPFQPKQVGLLHFVVCILQAIQKQP